MAKSLLDEVKQTATDFQAVIIGPVQALPVDGEDRWLSFAAWKGQPGITLKGDRVGSLYLTMFDLGSVADEISVTAASVRLLRKPDAVTQDEATRIRDEVVLPIVGRFERVFRPGSEIEAAELATMLFPGEASTRWLSALERA